MLTTIDAIAQGQRSVLSPSSAVRFEFGQHVFGNCSGANHGLVRSAVHALRQPADCVSPKHQHAWRLAVGTVWSTVVSPQVFMYCLPPVSLLNLRNSYGLVQALHEFLCSTIGLRILWRYSTMLDAIVGTTLGEIETRLFTLS